MPRMLRRAAVLGATAHVASKRGEAKAEAQQQQAAAAAPPPEEAAVPAEPAGAQDHYDDLMKLKSLLTGTNTESIFRADEKFDTVQLERKEVTYSYFADPLYVFMDNEYNQHEVEADNMGEAIRYLAEGLACELTFYEGKAISVELPTSVVREVKYTEPAVKGDTSGKVMKPAKLATGIEIQVPLFVTTGDNIEIDTRTGEYRRRV